MKRWDELKALPPAEIVAWAETQPWAPEMATCGQDAIWHAEGDVWTHTKLVVGQLLKLDGWASIERREQVILVFTALFHDSGKPATTIIEAETGRTRSPKHALVGTEIARRELRKLGCDLETRESIAGLVRFHGRPPYLLEKDNPEHELISLSWLVDHRLLYLFALADTRGRSTQENGRSEEALELWKMVAEERSCFGQPFAFANDHARFLFFRNELSSLQYAPRESFKCCSTLMVGLPGAGKDTWLARNRPGLPVVSLDEIRDDLEVKATDNQGRVVQAARELFREHLRAGRDFAFNATNLTRTMRQRWIGLSADYGARVELVYIEPPLGVILERNRGRERQVPERVILRLLEKTETPNLTEGHSLINVVD